MKKILRLILSFLLVPQMAIASHSHDLKNLIDDHWYFLTVEWDQEDREELQKRERDFSSKLSSLFESGLKDQDFAEVLKLPNSALFELNAISADDTDGLKDFIFRHQTYLKGSSWNGDVIGVLIFFASVGTFLTLFTIYAVNKNKKFNACVEANAGNEGPCIER